MKRPRFAEPPIALALRPAERTPAGETYRRLGVAAFVGYLFFASAAAAQTAAYSVYGTSDLDMSACASGGPTGTLSVSFWVIRAPTITGPTRVAFADLPTNVTVAVTPQTLTYPGWVIGQQVTAIFTVNAGVTIPDIVVHLQATDNSNAVSYELLLHGTCARHNKDFTLRGSFNSTQLGTSFPVAGTQVEIWRDVPYWFDQNVDSTMSEADGTFAAHVWASDVDTYYAKLRLNDLAGVYLHDWWSPEIKDYNSFNRGSNSQPVIDVGGTTISKDGGSGTPKSAVWQGGHWAFQEFTRTAGMPPPTGNYELVIQNTVSDITWTGRSTTNYEYGNQTYKYSGGQPIAESDPAYDPYLSQFINYSTNFHEFGHALRQTVDGNQLHFTNDASLYTYARRHTLCGSAAGYIESEGYGFNEGWAEYWSRDLPGIIVGNCSGINLQDMRIEGSVAFDLNMLAVALDSCLPPPAADVSLVQAERKAMFSILSRDQNIIHSDGDFRNIMRQQFPSCALPAVGVGVVRAEITQKALTQYRSAAQLASVLTKQIAFQRDLSARLRTQLVAAQRAGVEVRPCDSAPCTAMIAAVLRPVLLRAQLAYSDLIGQAFTTRLAAVRAQVSPVPDMSGPAAARDQARLVVFRASVEKIVLDALSRGVANLDRVASRDRTGSVVRKAADLKRTMKRLRLKAPINDEVFGMLKLPSGPADDNVSGPPRR